MGEFLSSSVDRRDVDTSRALMASILTAAIYGSIKALPVHVSPPERLVKKKIDDFTGLARITASYMPTSDRPSSINDIMRIQNHSYKCVSTPMTHLYSDNVALNDLLAIPHSDFVGIKKYIFNPLDENGCAIFDMTFKNDINSLNFCNADIADKFRVLTLEAFKAQKLLPILNENRIDPIPVYVFFIDNKYSIKNSETKVNGSSPGGKSIYLLHCNSDNNPDKYNYRSRMTH